MADQVVDVGELLLDVALVGLQALEELVPVRERPAPGYDLLERLPDLTGEQRVEMGNLYRLLRALEEEGVVSSEWDAESQGPAKRRYALTEHGLRLLDDWADALRRSQERIQRFLDRYEERR